MVEMTHLELSVMLNMDPTVKLHCQNDRCRYHLTNCAKFAKVVAACNLKHIVIGPDGHCAEEKRFAHYDAFQPMTEPSDDYGGMNTVLKEAGHLPIDDDFDPMSEPGTIKR